MQFYEAARTWQEKFEEQLRAGLKELLESKHLYQSVTIDVKETFERLRREIDNSREYNFHEAVANVRRLNWAVVDPASPKPPVAGLRPIEFRVPDVKLFCGRCDRIEAFNVVSVESFLDRGGTPVTAEQAFVISLLCQSCKSVPEAFLIRRVGDKLTLCGRAPMEVVVVPRVVPKGVRGFYSGALLAHQSGQTLPGVFMLRTLIEQWARSQVKEPPEQADQLMDAYMATQPEDFSQRFPSMRALYGDLSVDIHAATGSAELFERAAGEIVEHFDARRLFKMPA